MVNVRWLIISCLGFAISANALLAQDDVPRGEPVEHWLPPNTYLLLRCGNVAATRDAWDHSALGQMWLAPEMAAFRGENEKHTSEFSAQFRKAYGIPPELMLKYAQRQLYVAGIDTGSRGLTLAYFVQLPEGLAEPAKQFLAEAAAVLNAGGAKVHSDDFASPAVLYDLPVAGEQVVFAVHAGYLMISGDRETAQDICRVWSGQARPSLADQEVFQRVKQATLPKAESDMTLYVDPMHLMAALETEETKKQRVLEQQSLPFVLRHGFPGLRAVGGRLEINAQPFDLSGEFVVDAPKPFTEGLRVLDLCAGDLEMPQTIPDHVCSCAVTHWQLSSLIRYLGPVFDDMANSPGAYDRTLKSMRDELGVGLEQDLFDFLSTQICTQSYYRADKRLERSVAKIAIREPEKNEDRVAEGIYNLFAGDTSARRVRLQGKKHDLWKIRLKVGQEKIPFSTTGLMVADGHVWISTHASLIEELLAKKTSPRLSEGQDFKAHLSVWGDLLKEPGVLHGFIRSANDFECTYTAIREGGLKGLQEQDSSYAFLLSKMLGNTEGTSKVNYGTLPEFESVRKYFGLLGYVGKESETGWLIRFGSQVPDLQ